MKNKNLSPEQIAARDARREKFRQLVKHVAQMTDAQRAEIVNRIGAVPTCEGRALSLHNTLLLILQFPAVSIVGGFKQWIKQGRCVRKGEHGAMIWIPCGAKEKGAEPTAADTQAAAGEDRPNFLTATVFDISQTDQLPAA